MSETGRILSGEEISETGRIPAGEEQMEAGRTPTGEEQPETGGIPTEEEQPEAGRIPTGEEQLETGVIPTREEIHAALVEKQGAELTERLAQATVAVCGLGGLGSNIAVSLARAGVGKLILIDFDTVNVTNLHRQQYKASQVGRLKSDALTENLREIAPYTELEAHAVRIDETNAAGLLAGADVVCEAFDNARAKAMLVNLVLETMPEKYLVAASGMAGLDPANTVRTRKVLERFYLCGDGVSDVDEGLLLVPSRVMLCAAHQAHTVIRILAGEYEA